MEKKKLDEKNSLSLLEVLWKIVAPIAVAVIRLLWTEYGDKILAFFHWVFLS